MGKKAINNQQKNGTIEKQESYSQKGAQLFFNPKQAITSSKIQKAAKTKDRPPVHEIRLENTTDILLAGILEELRKQNMIELLKVNAQLEQEQKEQEAAEKVQEQDAARFEEIRHTLYA
ncbi:coiled-coil protein [Legionella wadsworthii]|uniref:Coiled-coil protein n=1 Tax=Legionella wadsworthii TaxID=28088 RepID=A0A378LW19_9GAMM|nr:hypothetical protein [Legionella wadsworthii]STY28261.1 coiled-coil protein [Legionella wadsworthii]